MLSLKQDDIKDPASGRHCAFCIQFGDYKLCGGCRKRAYCSPKCQVADWSPSGKGQRHKNWCRYDCGEEDVDFQVVDLPGKGLGLVAKTFIPRKYRIIVESLFSADRPVTEEPPTDASLVALMKRFQSGIHPPSQLDFKRCSRVNHDCCPNADLFYTNDGVAILYSNRDIEAGEEISRTYLPFSKMLDEPAAISVQFQCRETILRKVGINCPSSCICKAPATRKLVERAVQLKILIKKQSQIGYYHQVMQSYEKLISIHKFIATPLVVVALQSHLDAFEACQRYYSSLPHRPTEPEVEECEHGVEHGRIVYELCSTLRPHDDHAVLKKDVQDLSLFISNLKKRCKQM